MIHVVPTKAQTLQNNEMLKLNNEQAQTTAEIEKIMKNDSYPPYYGGVYISEDSSKVILQIVKNNIPKTRSSKVFSTFNEITTKNDNVKIEYVENSYKELNDINERLIEYYSSGEGDISNLVAHYVDVFNNVVVVELIDNSTTLINNIKQDTLESNSVKFNTITSNTIKFTKGYKQQNYATTLKAGQQINVPGGTCSIGYRVKINGKSGYITAGHCFSKIGQSATGGTVKRYKEAGKVDAAFVETSSTYSPSNNLNYTNGSITYLNSTVCPILSLNQEIAKVGSTTGYTSGKIKSLNFSGNYDGTYFTGLIATDYSSSYGDSGGAVFVPKNLNSGGVAVAGITKGSSSYGSVFVNADEIYAAFNYLRY